jgi:hypothetical protein
MFFLLALSLVSSAFAQQAGGYTPATAEEIAPGSHCHVLASYAFEQLKAEADTVQKEVGAALQWRPMLDKGSSKIVLEERIDPKDPANRRAVCDWFAHWTPKMFLAFADRVKALSAPE